MYVASMLALLGAIPDATVATNIAEPKAAVSTINSSKTASHDDPQEDAAACSDIVNAVVKRRVTYCDWSKKDRSPETFTALTLELIGSAKQQGCIFLRKLKLPIKHSDSQFNSSSKKRSLDDDDRDLTDYNERRLAMLRSWLTYVIGLDPNSEELQDFIRVAQSMIIEQRNCDEKREQELMSSTAGERSGDIPHTELQRPFNSTNGGKEELHGRTHNYDSGDRSGEKTHREDRSGRRTACTSQHRDNCYDDSDRRDRERGSSRYASSRANYDDNYGRYRRYNEDRHSGGGDDRRGGRR